MSANKTSPEKNLEQMPCRHLKGVGPKLSEKLEKLHIHNILDLLFHLPYRYEDRTSVYPIASLQDGARALIKVTIESARIVFGKRRSLVVRAYDDSANIEFRFFYFNKSQQQRLVAGAEFYAFGEVKRFGANFSIVHPELVDAHGMAAAPLLEALTPVYSTTEGMHQATWRQLLRQALTLLKKHPIDNLLSPSLLDSLKLDSLKLPDINQCLHWIHLPPKGADLEQLTSNETPAVKRLIIEELLAQQLSLMVQREKQKQQKSTAMPLSNRLVAPFLEQLSFTLTAAQSRVSKEISQDLSRTLPMLRLLQGDVGAGKTVVAALAALQAIESDVQVAIMAPTEILAEQHFQSFARWFEPLGIKVVFLVSKLSASQRRQALAAIADGSAQLVVGTHALFQDEVQYDNLGFAIIDEQHRFGVNQRLQLRNKAKSGFHLHQLMMTATPIPRTLAMTVYADMDLSIIDELPPGRTPIKTVALSDQRRDQVIESIEQAVKKESRQVYWVCTLIEESEEIQSQAAESTAELLAEQLPSCRIGLVHGRLKSEQKQMVMDQFKQGNLDILVATTVIEVGVDVPNASLMIIENPERLGLAQLHQLRGRVGRGTVESHCLLLYQLPLSNNAKARIQVMRDTNDGFIIAEEDLKLRGSGEILGTRQTGEVSFRFADIVRDADFIPKIRPIAQKVVEETPEIAEKLTQRWISTRDDFLNI